MAQQLCQAVHAAYEAGIRFGDPHRISSVVVCSVPDERALQLAEARIRDNGIKSYMFTEPDIGDEATALATEPIFGAARRVLSKYPLWNVGQTRPLLSPEELSRGQGRDTL
jgi:hypothetical protein